MSDYYGSATLEDWLREEVFACQCKVPPTVVALFERWRGGVERNIESWLETDRGDGSASWRGWGRGFCAVPDEDDDAFDAAVKEGRAQLARFGGVEVL